ncbi:MAG: type I-E CRISPR-associated endonuclease Cas1e [Gemmatimonadota bacterium]|nr:type I-E CRISPR-associated endonuclease Cas1e [Gemmatimonadota bacterium]
MLLGRLGLDTARIPHADRHGLLWLSRGALTVRDGTLSFERVEVPSAGDVMDLGRYSIPFQDVSMILLGPGSTVSHDALRILARHGTALAAVGVDGVRMYTAPPLISGRSSLARTHARTWANEEMRLDIARRMYAWRLGQVFPHHSLSALRGMEGARMRETYRLIAKQIGIEWRGRRYDRERPDAADLPNQALNHASSAVESAAAVAVAATATIPQLGFIHEDPSQSFVLDIADLFRDSVLIPAAFRAAKQAAQGAPAGIERLARKEIGATLSKTETIPKMITRIKELFPKNPS